MPASNTFVRTLAMLIFAAAAIAAPNVPLPDESVGIDGIVRTLISAFDKVDVVALGETHEWKLDSDIRIALVRHPDFAKKVRSILVEFGSTTAQPILDRYVRGENVSKVQLDQVWKTTTQAVNGLGSDPIYVEFFAAVRDVNAKLPVDARIRVLGGDPGPGDHRSRETAAVAVLKEQVLQKHGKALVIYGAGHFYRAMPQVMVETSGEDNGIVNKLEKDYPGRTLSVIPVGGPIDLPPGLKPPVNPDYGKFDRALKTQMRPVMVPLQRAPFRDFTAEEFLGSGIFRCEHNSGCRSVFQGSKLTLGQITDAVIFVGGTDAAVGARGKRTR